MGRRAKIALRIAGGLVGLLVLLGIAGIFVARSDWFRDKVRDRIVRELETSTGGRVEIASFRFYWRQLRAEVKNTVIHGTEATGAKPLLRVPLLQVDLKIVSLFKREIDITALVIQGPEVNITVDAEGRTNIPEPKVKKTSDKSALETVLDLAIGRF